MHAAGVKMHVDGCQHVSGLIQPFVQCFAELLEAKCSQCTCIVLECPDRHASIPNDACHKAGSISLAQQANVMICDMMDVY